MSTMTTPQPSPPRPPRRKPKTWEAWGAFAESGDESVLVLTRTQRSEAECLAELNEWVVRRVEIRLAPTRRRKGKP